MGRANQVTTMNVFELLREQVDLVELARRFTEMSRAGRLVRGRCPLPTHQDSSPSFFIYPDSRAHCFGCGFHGDVVDLWAAVKGVALGIESALDLACEYRIRLPERDPEAQKKAAERRDKEHEYERQAIACHSALLQHRKIAAYWDGRGFDEELRQRFLPGSNHDGTAATIPLWNHGRVQGLIRRQLEGKAKYNLPLR
jgi:DNA primase